MLSEHNIVLHVYYVHDVFGILVPQKLQNLQLNSSLVYVLFLVLHYFQSNLSVCLVVDTLKCSTKTTLT